ncbi:MAG: hypothetical protein IJX14_09630 [Clostridia bacterium]|nr:hypothetical protein [Clostridia bacterium]
MPMITLPNVNERKHIHIINPCAGDGRLYEGVKKAASQTGEEVRLTEGPGDVEKICRDEIAGDPFVHLVVYGGDGTVHEAVNGIMTSGRALTASFSVIPAGSGNDFSAYANGAAGFTPPDLQHLDVIKTVSREDGGAGTVRYYANSLNLGFDGQVVMEADRYKHQKGLRGKTAYIAGVASVLLKKRPVKVRITLEGVTDMASGGKEVRQEGQWGTLYQRWNGDTVEIEGEILLTACANGPFCGGGFKGAPLCSMTDGKMDVLVVQNITRRRFISMVGAYHDGTYVNGNGVIRPEFRNVLEYFQCRKMHLQTEEAYCLDGEICGKATDLTVEVMPEAVWFAAL